MKGARSRLRFLAALGAVMAVASVIAGDARAASAADRLRDIVGLSPALAAAA